MNVASIVQQLYPSLSVEECTNWVSWIATQPNYHIDEIGHAGCISKVYSQTDPPWLHVAQEVAWWGHGKAAVRALHHGMDWARLQGATLYGYSLAPHYLVFTWRRL